MIVVILSRSFSAKYFFPDIPRQFTLRCGISYGLTAGVLAPSFHGLAGPCIAGGSSFSDKNGGELCVRLRKRCRYTRRPHEAATLHPIHAQPPSAGLTTDAPTFGAARS